MSSVILFGFLMLILFTFIIVAAAYVLGALIGRVLRFMFGGMLS
jgi:hypothetical protein